MVAFALAVCVGTACSDDETTRGPTADFTMSPICDLVPALGVVSSSVAGDAQIVLHVWDFHDGTSSVGIAQEHRWGTTPGPGPGEPLSVEITLTVMDGNGLGDTKTKTTELASCLSVGASSVEFDGTSATPHIEITNNSASDDALVSFSLDVIRPNGLPLALGLDGGQHPIARGSSVDVSSTEPVDCGSECAAFTTATIVPHVTSTYWCGGLCP